MSAEQSRRKRSQTRADVPSRRQFGKRVALLAAAPLAAPALAAEQDKKPKEVPVPTAVAVLLAEAVRIHHGKHLSKDQLKQVANSIARSQFSAERLRHFELSNADEPAFTFRADLP
jgi:hypothetical protein